MDAASQTEKLMASTEFEFVRATNRAKQAQSSTCVSADLHSLATRLPREW